MALSRALVLALLIALAAPAAAQAWPNKQPPTDNGKPAPGAKRI